MTISDDPSNHPQPAHGPAGEDTAAGERSGAASNGSSDASNPLRWQNILATVAAAAGSAAWVSAVGSGVMGARLKNAGMPVESVLALMPAEQRFAIGVGHLLAPLFVGLVGFLADLALTVRHERLDDGSPTPGAGSSPPILLRDQFRPSKFASSTRRKVAAGTIAFGAVVGALLLEPPSLWLYLLQIAAIIVALVVVYVFGPRQGKAASERGAVFLLVLVLAGVIAFGFERVRDAEFDFAAVTFTDSGEPPLAGYYVTTTANAVLLITLGAESDEDACPTNESLGRITALPDNEIERVWIGPNEVKFALADYCAQKQQALSAIVG